MHTVNHLTGTPKEGDKRNVMEESARISRGKVEELQKLSPKSFDAIFFPGGFGAAKNLSNFATEGDKMQVEQEVIRVIKEAVASKTHLGLCCISPILVAKVLGK